MAGWAVGFGLIWLTARPGCALLLGAIGHSRCSSRAAAHLAATLCAAAHYRYASYRIDEQGIVIRRGVLVRTVTTVPRSRVQHTDVSQGPIERRFGLGTLSIYTAGTVFAEVALPGLAYETATSIRDMLLPKHGADGV